MRLSSFRLWQRAVPHTGCDKQGTYQGREAGFFVASFFFVAFCSSLPPRHTLLNSDTSMFVSPPFGLFFHLFTSDDVLLNFLQLRTQQAATDDTHSHPKLVGLIVSGGSPLLSPFYCDFFPKMFKNVTARKIYVCVWLHHADHSHVT